MYRKPLPPLPASPSQYGIGLNVGKRAVELPEVGAVLMSELFPAERKQILYPRENGLEKIRKATEESLEAIDMSMIKPNHSVNILGSHHSFLLMGGDPYVEMIKTVKNVISKRTGATDIRLRAGVGLRFRESEEHIKRFGLDSYFQGKALGVAPVDKGIPIQTNIGTLYGIKRVYDADWIVHTHNTDIREVHFHRLVDRIIKPFGMSYARYETRSIYHHNLGPRGANFVARAIFDSDFVKNKFAFSTIMKIFPVGITGIDSDNNLLKQNERITIESLKEYGKVVQLLGKIDDCIVILDCPGPIPYTFGGGLIFGNFISASVDQFDLDAPLTPYSFFTEMSFDENGDPRYEGIPPCNPAIKMIINNYSFKGYPSTFFAEHMPTVVVGKEMANLFYNCPQNPDYMSHAVTADSLDAAIKFAYKSTGTKKVIIFDGAREGINASYSLIDFLLKYAPGVVEEMERKLLPKWLKQRGIGPITRPYAVMGVGSRA